MAISTISSAGLAAGAIGSTQLASGAAVANIGSGGITSTQLATAVQPIGVGQTWTNMSGSRAMGTTYTNSTGRPIEVAVSPQGGGQLTYTIVINGTTLAQTGSNAGEYMSIIVPSGATYSFTNSGGTGFVYWFELR